MSETQTQKTQQWIHTSKAHMPLNCMGCNNYFHLAVIESEIKPKIIRDTKTQEVIHVIRKLYRGKTPQSEYYRARKRLQAEYPKAKFSGYTQ